MTNKQVDWINVRYSDVSQSENSKKHGLTIRFMTAPQDVPDMWRHEIQTTSEGWQEAVFEFKYLASKEPSRWLNKDGISIEVGKNSRRVYSIRYLLPLLDLESTIEEIEIKIEMAIEKLEQQGELRPAHADVIQAMLRKPERQIAF